MHYFSLHVGDYATATAHLSDAEFTIYTRLLLRYYSSEKPICADIGQIMRLLLIPKANKKALESVLSEFFFLELDGWHNKRADIEIEKYMRIVEGGKAGAAKRWSNKPALKKDSPPMPPPLGRQY